MHRSKTGVPFDHILDGDRQSSPPAACRLDCSERPRAGDGISWAGPVSARLDPAFGASGLKPGGFHCVPIDGLEVAVLFQPDGVEALAKYIRARSNLFGASSPNSALRRASVA
jgi:hypothetical protein